jgi:small-conductance mechanosensitive channel
VIFRRPDDRADELAKEIAEAREQNRVLTLRIHGLESLLSEARHEIEELNAELGVLHPLGAAPVTTPSLSDEERRELNQLRDRVKTLTERLDTFTIASMEADFTGAVR